MRSEGQDSTSSRPIRALSLALGVTALALGGLAWNAVTSIERIEAMKRRDLRIESLRGRIVYLDEVLTMSARMAAATGDPQWEARYRRFDPELDRAIAEAVGLAPEAGAGDVVARTEAANTALVGMENKAFELIRRKNLEEARATLFSKEYDRLKTLYADGMHALDAVLQQSVQRAREREFRRARFVLIISAAILLVLLVSWFIALRTMNRWRAKLARNQERLAAQAAELAQLNAGLDKKVAERTGELEQRTAELAKTNEDLRAEVVERRRGEVALRESEGRYRGIIDSALDAVVTMDEHGVITAWNARAEEVFGWEREEAVGRSVSATIIPTTLREAHERGLRHYLATGEGPVLNRRIEITSLHRDGREFPVELAISPAQSGGKPIFSAFIRDITERKQLEEQFRQAQKMEAVGQLAGGVAHDFNNLLTTIIGYGELVLGQLPSGSKGREEMLEVLKAGERAAVLTRQLLAFSRKQLLAPVVLDLNKVVTHLQKMLERLIGAQIELSTVLEPRVACIRADSGQLEQVIVNLVVNARDAMPGGGQITIETRNVDLSEEYAQEKRYVTPGPHVRLTVSDNGTGMDAKIQSKIFEPFFTTKEQGKGTGLGLSMVYGIVKQSGGSIEVQSEPGQGTSFQLYFPVTAEKAPEPSRARPSESTKGSGTILLVEDEDAVRSFVRRALQAEGYSVLEAPNAEIAMKVADAHAGAIGLLLTDIIMPGVSGPELAVALRQARPEMKVLFISGYTGDAVLRTGGLEANAAFLQKPFNPAALGLKVRELLSETEREI